MGTTYAGEADPYRHPREDGASSGRHVGRITSFEGRSVRRGRAVCGQAVRADPTTWSIEFADVLVRRIGHAGTLDPMATGVLIIGVGPTTRLLKSLEATTRNTPQLSAWVHRRRPTIAKEM